MGTKNLLIGAVLVAACSRGAAVEPAAELQLAPGNATAATVAYGPGGAAYAAWIEEGDAGPNVVFSPLDAVDAPVRVNDIAGDAAAHDQAPPQVRVGPEGNVYVVWQNRIDVPGRRFPASNLRLARSIDGGRTFEPAIFVNDDAHEPPSSHSFHDIAVAGDGSVFVSWIDGRARTRAEAAQGAAENHTGAGRPRHHDHDAGLPGSDVRVARSDDGGRTFSAGVVAHENVCPCCRTALAVAPDGRVYVAFRSAGDNVRDILVRHSNDGGLTFSDPVPVHDDGWLIDGCPHAGPSLVVTRDGVLHVAWYTGADDRQGVWYARSADGGLTFAPPLPLQAGGWNPVAQVRLAAGEDGTVWAAWEDRRDEPHAVRLASIRGTRVQGFDGLLHSGAAPALAGRANGEGLALVWRGNDGILAQVLDRR